MNLMGHRMWCNTGSRLRLQTQHYRFKEVAKILMTVVVVICGSPLCFNQPSGNTVSVLVTQVTHLVIFFIEFSGS